MTAWLKRYLTFWTVSALIVFCLFFVLLQWNGINAPFERDEGHYAYGAWIMTKGGLPYVNTFEQKPPLIFFPYLLALLINPSALWPVHLIAFFSFALTVVLLGLLAGREFGRRAGWLVIWLAVPMVMFPPLNPYAANTEKFMILPLAGLLAIYAFNRERAGPWPWFWGAVCGLATILYKQIAVLVVLYVFLVWLYESYQAKRTPRELIVNCLYALAGAAATLVMVTGYFFARGAWPGFWEEAVVYNRYYFASTGGLTTVFLANFIKLFFRSWPALFYLLAWVLVRRPARVSFYLGLLAAGLLTVFNSPYGHYYIMLMPLWAIVSAAALDSLIEQFTVTFQRPAWRDWLTVILGFFVVLSLIWPVRDWLRLSPTELTARSYGYLNSFVEAPLVARRVAELARPDDYVYIAGTEQEILYYAKRLGPTRVVGMYAMMLDQTKALAYQQEVVRDLEQKRPAVIVWVRSPLSWLARPSSPRLIMQYLNKLMKARYVLVGGSLRRDAAAEWQEPLKKENDGICSIKVYKLIRK